MKIFDLVAGVNEFLSCGRATTLNAYMEKRREKVSRQDQTMLRAIGEVANGIQWCLIPNFQNGLQNLQKFFQTENTTTSQTTNESSYLQIYKDDIRLDYGKLVTQHSVLDEIDWCIRKGFYQQALTLIESKVSNLIITEWKILEFHPGKKFLKENNGKYRYYRRSESYPLNEFFNFYIFAFTDTYSSVTYYLKDDDFNKLNRNAYNNFVATVSKNRPTNSIDIDAIFKYADENICTTKEGQQNYSKSKQAKTDNEKQSAPKPQSIMKGILKSSSSLDPTVQNLVFKIFVLHKSLKKVRNNMNHAADNVPYKVEAIRLALEYYQKWMRTLEKNIESRKK